MQFKEAQKISVMLTEDGYSSWAVDGFFVNLMIDGILYEIKKAKRQPNERS